MDSRESRRSRETAPASPPAAETREGNGLGDGGEAAGAPGEGAGEKPMGGESPYRLIFRNPYLLAIAFLILFLNWVNTNGEYILGSVVRSAAVTAAVSAGYPQEERSTDAPDRGAKEAHEEFVSNYIGKFYADFFGVVNVTALVLQLFLVSRIIKYLGGRFALLTPPCIALGGYALAAFFPVLAFIRWTKTAENATDYSLMNTLKGVLFLPTTREQKYKAKQAIDTIFVRAGDVLSALLVFLGTQYLAFRTKHFALFNIVLVVVWIVLALRIGRGFMRMTDERPAEETEAGRTP